MDGCSKQDVPEKEIRVVPDRENKRHREFFGKQFYDPGDNDFKKGLFTILCYNPGSGFEGREPSYWCERSGCRGTRKIEPLNCKHVMKLLKEYEGK